MKNINKTTIVIAISTLVIGILLGWLIFGRSEQSASQEGTVSELGVSEITYTCSMHPHVRQNEPGDCPICGMELIPLDDDAGDELNPMAVRMSATAMQLAQVQTMVVSSSAPEKNIRLNGKVQVDERLLQTQSSHIPGRIEKLSVNYTGEYIFKGQVIAHLYSPELVTAQEELFEAQKISKTQPALFKAAKEKLKNWKLSDQQIEQIITSGKTVEEFPILANVSGYVTKKMVNLGDYIKQGQSLFEIANLSKVWVLFDVYESEMSWIKKGDQVTYAIQSLPGKSFKGSISYIDPVIDPKTRVAKARIEVSNRDMSLKPEMFATGTVLSQINTSLQSISIPKTAVMWTGKRSVVYVMQNTAQGIGFSMRQVILGPELGDTFIIESGLEAGEVIATNGTFSIDAAAQLAGKPSMMNPEGGVAMTGHNHSDSGNGQAKIMSESLNKEPAGSKEIVVSTEAKRYLVPLFESYFEMKSALALDDFEKAKEAGVRLSNEVEDLDMDLFKGNAHTFWMMQSTTLKNSLEHTAHVKEIKQIRTKFITVSSAMIAIAESFLPFSETIYVQYCPMADSNKGANWLSKSEIIENPYFGSSMFSCGEVIKTLK